MTSEELWEYFGRELMTSEYGLENRKFVAFFSRKNNKFLEKLAIGGGGLALCDVDYLNTWPTTIDDISISFINQTFISLMPSFCTIPYVFLCKINIFEKFTLIDIIVFFFL